MAALMISGVSLCVGIKISMPFFTGSISTPPLSDRPAVGPLPLLPLLPGWHRYEAAVFLSRSMAQTRSFAWAASARRRRTKPKFLTGSDGILLIRQEIIQSSISNYWQQGEQRIGLGLQRSRLWHLLKAWGGVFRFQPIGHACSTG